MFRLHDFTVHSFCLFVDCWLFFIFFFFSLLLFLSFFLFRFHSFSSWFAACSSLNVFIVWIWISMIFIEHEIARRFCFFKCVECGNTGAIPICLLCSCSFVLFGICWWFFFYLFYHLRMKFFSRSFFIHLRQRNDLTATLNS